MFSNRTQWHRQPNRLAETLRALRTKGDAVIDLTHSNPTTCGIGYPAATILNALSDPAALLYKPDPLGLASARQAVAAYYAAKGVAVDHSRILLTASTSEAYGMAFALFCDPGDEVLVPVPSYPLFDYLAQLSGVRVGHYSLRYDGQWHIDLPSLRCAVGPRTRAVVAVSPHNPTGMYLKKRELGSLSEICSEHDLALVVDEVFSDYPLEIPRDDWVRSTAAWHDAMTCTLSGISKIAGLPQLKLAWLIVGGPVRAATEAMERLEIIADTYLSVNTAVQLALPRVMEAAGEIRTSIAGRTGRNLSFLKRSLAGTSPCTLLAGEGGWYAVLRLPRIFSDEEWALRLLADERVYVHPGYFFEFEGDDVVVLCLLVPEEEFAAGVERILEHVEASLQCPPGR